jgi:putative PIN family toxin of toxin-antitoxin system
MKRIVVDTNILISALGWKDGNPRKTLDRCIQGKCKLIESIDLIKEFLAVIQRPKFDFISEDEKAEFLLEFIHICDTIEPKRKITLIMDDPNDNLVLECAFEGKADYIISGDEHLLKLKEFEGIKIISAADFLDLVL